MGCTNNNMAMKPKNKDQIIGGMFGLEEILNPNSSAPPFLDNRSILLANARSGIALLVELLSPAHVWMHSYLCEANVLCHFGEFRK